MDRAFKHLVGLLTVVWLLFLLAASSIAFLVKPVLDMQSSSTLVSVVRTLAGMAVFGLWVYIWHKIAEIWLYKILLKRDRT
ncbi:MAG: hypothetical protein QXY50_07660 [Candidatus Caldarchaeum sp.]